ncbi:MAG: hypothetical protein ACPLRU_03995 [Desulfofundulus sp.]|uniref:hypothetical protein n=1 Tax=Desulfofundulus sp. TaxID=2282750 RepID=UPI003C774AAF
MRLRESFQSWWIQRNPRGQRMLKLTGALITVSLFYFILSAEFQGLADARRELDAKRQELYVSRVEAAKLPREKERLELDRMQWKTVKAAMSRNVGTGITIADLERAAKNHGANLSSVEPGELVEKYYHGHLQAVPVRVKLQGQFPAVLAALKDYEKLANPGEIRFLKISSEEEEKGPPGTVTAETILVLYSLNMPEWYQPVQGAPPPGRPDAFQPLILPQEDRQTVSGTGVKQLSSGSLQAPAGVP